MNQLNVEVQRKLQELAEIYEKHGICMIGCEIATIKKVVQPDHTPMESCGFSSN